MSIVYLTRIYLDNKYGLKLCIVRLKKAKIFITRMCSQTYVKEPKIQKKNEVY